MKDYRCNAFATIECFICNTCTFWNSQLTSQCRAIQESSFPNCLYARKTNSCQSSTTTKTILRQRCDGRRHFNCLKIFVTAHCIHTCNGIGGVATCISAVRIRVYQVKVLTFIAGEVCTAYFRQAYVCSLVFSGSDLKGIGRTINSVCNCNVCG